SLRRGVHGRDGTVGGYGAHRARERFWPSIERMRTSRAPSCGGGLPGARGDSIGSPGGDALMELQDSLVLAVEALCAPDCAGRAPGTAQGAAARRLIHDRFREADTQAAGIDGFYQEVRASRGVNIIARVPGRGPQASRAVLVGAHYDHLGQAFGEVYWGADDNAAGVAVLLALADGLMTRRGELQRSVVLCAFDAEEPPFFLMPGMGSAHFVAHPTVALERIDMMICLDVIGHALGPPGISDDVRESVFCVGAERS